MIDLPFTSFCKTVYFQKHPLWISSVKSMTTDRYFQDFHQKLPHVFSGFQNQSLVVFSPLHALFQFLLVFKLFNSATWTILEIFSFLDFQFSLDWWLKNGFNSMTDQMEINLSTLVFQILMNFWKYCSVQVCSPLVFLDVSLIMFYQVSSRTNH